MFGLRQGFVAMALLLVVVIAAGPAYAHEASAFAGEWQGAIDIAGMPLDIVAKFAFADSALEGTVDIPAQGAIGIPLAPIEVDGDEIRFWMAGVPGDPQFHGALSGDVIQGVFSQAGAAFPFQLVRASSADGDGSAAAPDVYVDPNGRFTIPVPTGWTYEEGDGVVVFSDPDSAIRMGVVAAEAADLEAAVDLVWERMVPGFDLEPVQTIEAPAEPGFDRSIAVNYPLQDLFYQAAAVQHQGVAYVLLIEGDMLALQRRAAQVQIIATGLDIVGMEKVEVKGAPMRSVSEFEAELDAFIEATMEALSIPGAAVAVVQDDKVVYLKGFGVKEAGGDDPVTPDTQMMIGSTGKTMTTMLMAALIDEGLLDWETPVVSVLPQFAVADADLTQSMVMRHLVCACTGVPRRDFELLFNADNLSAEDIIESLQTFEFFTEFGEAFQYSNQLVAVGGYAAAAADGAEPGGLFDGYVDSLRRRVLDPIGMNATTLSIAEAVQRGDYATPHQLDLFSGEYVPVAVRTERLLASVAPAGTHWSTARDMARYLLTQLDVGVTPDGTRVVSEENLRATWQPQVPMSATESYGLGWMTGEYKGEPVLYHGGNTMGFTSDFAFMPERGFGVVVLANAQGVNVFNESVRVRLFELAFDLDSEIEASLDFLLAEAERAFDALQSSLKAPVDGGEVEPFLGRWTNDALGDIELAFDSGRLTLDAGEFRSGLVPTPSLDGEPSYMIVDGPLAGVLVATKRDDAGRPAVQLGGGTVEYVFGRAE